MGTGEETMVETKSMLQQESALRWGFLKQEKNACAIVSDRMEIVYMNEPARRLVLLDWFGRRCFEVFPTAKDLCAIGCPRGSRDPLLRRGAQEQWRVAEAGSCRRAVGRGQSR
jgi:hypothetical protein